MGTKRLENWRLIEAVNGSITFLGTIVSAGTAINNHTTASAFNNTGDALGGKVLLLQATAALYLLPGTSNAASVTSTNGVKLGADERVIVTMSGSQGWLAQIPVSGSANLKVWELS
jgi:hypothetical protein